VTARAAIAAAVLAALVALFAYKVAAKMPDFEVYWRAGGRALAAEPLYRDEDEHFQLKYLPAFAVLAIPAALLPLPVAKAIWFGVTVALIPVLVALSIGLLPARRRPASLLAAITLVLMAKFYGHELVLGQINVLFAVVIAGAVHALGAGRPAGAGALVALAVIVKPYAVLFVPWLGAQRAVRALIFAAAGMTAALLLPVPLYGARPTIALHVDWWRTVTQSTAPNLLNADNVSLAAMFAKWIGSGTATAMLATLSAAALLTIAALVFLKRREIDRPEGLEAALLLTMIPLLSPQGWDYVLLLATPAVVCIVDRWRELDRTWRFGQAVALVFMCLTMFDLMGRQLYGRFMALSLVTVAALLLAMGLAHLRWRRLA
jgi:hypothetical protein